MKGKTSKAHARQNRTKKLKRERYRNENRRGKNAKKRHVRTIKAQPNNRDLALLMEKYYGTEFAPSPHIAENKGFQITKVGIAYRI